MFYNMLPILKHLAGRHNQQKHGREEVGQASAGLRKGTVLQPHQQRAVAKIKAQPAVLVYHGLGAGKTLTSIAAAEEVGGTKQVIVPASLRYNYQKEVKKFVARPKGYDIKSYNSVVAKGVTPADITIIDEAHRMGRSDSATSKIGATLADSKKVVLLSGTPIRNDPSEIVPLLRAIAGDRFAPKTVDDFKKRFTRQKIIKPDMLGRLLGVKPVIVNELTNISTLKNLLHGRVDYQPSSGEFPSVTRQQVELPMSKAQERLYKEVLSDNPVVAYKIRRNLPPTKSDASLFNAFMNTSRQLSNDPAAFDKTMTGDKVLHSPKMTAICKDVEAGLASNKNYKALIYSNWIDSGIQPIADHLAAKGIAVETFTGKDNDKSREAIVGRYNTGKTKVLLISGAGSEGIDLKGTTQVHVMEPHWNESKIDQVVGRATRHQSHSHLLPEEQHVDVKVYTTSPADKYLINLAAKKQAYVNQLLNILKEVGSEK